MKPKPGAILLLVAGLCLSGPIEAAKFSGRPLHMTGVSKANQVTLDAVDAWFTMPNMVVDFTTTKTGPAVATFCVEVETGSPLLIRIRESGVGDWEPGATEFISETAGAFEVYCFSWFATLPPGDYKIKAQWMNLLGGNAPRVENRSLRVEHEK